MGWLFASKDSDSTDASRPVAVPPFRSYDAGEEKEWVVSLADHRRTLVPAPVADLLRSCRGFQPLEVHLAEFMETGGAGMELSEWHREARNLQKTGWFIDDQTFFSQLPAAYQEPN